MGGLRELAPDLWVTERPLSFGGVEFGCRMTVIRLADGSLFLHSPVAPDPGLRDELEQRGTPRFAVAPNRFHHLYIGEYPKIYPDIELYAAPGLAAKRTDLAFRTVLEDSAPPGWASELDQVVFQGMPFVNEVAFCHRASQTLILSDLAFNIGADAHWTARLFFRLVRGYGRFGPSLLERILIRDRRAARSCLAQMLHWDFERVIVAHGSVLERGGRDALRAGYAWLL